MTGDVPKTVAMAACVVLAALAGGCKGGSSDSPFTLQGMWGRLRGPTPSEQVAMTFDVEDPDRRREGILGLSSHDWGLREPYLKGYATILRTDTSPLVRSAAVRALGKARDPNYLPDVVAALSDAREAVRHDAAVALDSLPGPAAVEPLRTRARQDASQDVRAACAKALRHYPERDVLNTLVQCLGDEAFGVRWQAHESLVALSGQDRGYDAADWVDVALEGAPGPPARKQRPWWDLLGVTKPKPPEPPATQPGR
jgi:hypothetical protein